MERNKKYFEYLDDLRESGETNMYGAASYLQDEFLLSREKARTILREWMKSYRGGSDAQAAAGR